LWRVQRGGAGGGLAMRQVGGNVGGPMGLACVPSAAGGEERTRRWGEEPGGCGCGMQRCGGLHPRRESRVTGWGSGISGDVRSFKHGIAVSHQINRSYVPDRLDQPLWGFY
jgi:hypothetical protein